MDVWQGRMEDHATYVSQDPKLFNVPVDHLLGSMSKSERKLSIELSPELVEKSAWNTNFSKLGVLERRLEVSLGR